MQVAAPTADDSPRPSKRPKASNDSFIPLLSSAEDALITLLASYPDDTSRQPSEEGPSKAKQPSSPLPNKPEANQNTLSGGNRQDSGPEKSQQDGKTTSMGPPPRPLFVPAAPAPGPVPEQISEQRGFQDVFYAFSDLPEPIVLIATLLWEVQQRVSDSEAATRAQSHQVEMLGQTAVATRRTIRSMVTEWRDLVVKMQGAVAEHTLGLQQHREAFKLMERRVAMAEAETQTWKKETLELRKEMQVLRETMVTMFKVAEGQEALRKQLENQLTQILAAQRHMISNRVVNADAERVDSPTTVVENKNNDEGKSGDVAAAAAEGGGVVPGNEGAMTE